MTQPSESGPISLTAYIDGACRGNPGPAACAAVILCDGQTVLEAGEFLGESTNNRAEYRGLLLALSRAAEFPGCHRLTVMTDSQLMARQVRGEYKIRDDELRALKRDADALIAKFDCFEIHDIRRKHNAAADKLANKYLDAGLNKSR